MLSPLTVLTPIAIVAVVSLIWLLKDRVLLALSVPSVLGISGVGIPIGIGMNDPLILEKSELPQMLFIQGLGLCVIAVLYIILWRVKVRIRKEKREEMTYKKWAG